MRRPEAGEAVVEVEVAAAGEEEAVFPEVAAVAVSPEAVAEAVIQGQAAEAATSREAEEASPDRVEAISPGLLLRREASTVPAWSVQAGLLQI
jgi:hypothetical protein